FIARSLGIGESIVVPGMLRFQIPRPVIVEPADPLVIQETIWPTADQLGPEPAGHPVAATPFQRRFDNATFTHTCVARFPVQNTEGIRVLLSLAPGEQSRIIFSVDNIASVALGSDSAVGRRVRVQLELTGGDIEPEQLVFLDAEGSKHILHDTEDAGSGYYIEAPLIEP